MDVELAGVAVVVLLTVEDEEVGLAAEEVAVVAGLLAEELEVVGLLVAALLEEGWFVFTRPALVLVLVAGLATVEVDVRDVFTEEPEAVEGREVVVVEGRDVLVVEGREVVVAEGRA